MTYSDEVRARYSKQNWNDDPTYGYSLRNTSGFFMSTMIKKSIINCLNQSQIKLRECEKIVDLGCGDGGHLRFLAEIRNSSKGLLGIDLAEEQIQIAKDTNPGIEYKIGDITRLDIPSESVDLVTAFVSLMYLKSDTDLYSCLDEIYRILKPQGHFLLYDTGKTGDDNLRSFDYITLDQINKTYNYKEKVRTFQFAMIPLQKGLWSTTAYKAAEYKWSKLLDIEEKGTSFTNFMMVVQKV